MSLTLVHVRSFLRTHRPASVTPTDPAVIRAAVLVPLTPVDGALHVLLTKRTERVEHHKGQISFPGGAADDGDHDAVDTALREAEEEIGLPRSAAEVLGPLDEIEIPTGFVVTPVAAYIQALPPLRLNPGEVEEAFTVPVDLFLDPSNEVAEERVWRGRTHRVYHYDYAGHRIWGATAFILRNLAHNAAKSADSSAG